ncbi:MAG: AbrB family transcriptional regulator [Pseudomonadota bacterium]
MILSLLAHLALGAVGGYLASVAGLPMPFLLGALVAVAPLVIWQGASGRATLVFPTSLRFAFVGGIGALIGAGFTPELVRILPALWVSLLGVGLFVVVAHLAGYLVYRKLGGYDRVTSLYGSMPGGLIEGVALGEKAGGDVMLLTVHHFARIVIVVFTVPLLFAVFSGELVGSAAGLALSSGGGGLMDVLGLVAVTLAGLSLSRLVRLPAGHLTGPLLVAAALHGAGLMALESPAWLVALAQLVVGTSLATQFAGATPRVLGRAFGLTMVAVGAMFAAAALIASAVARNTPLGFDEAFISFAPGGVAEMGLIALSLDISPVIITAHHLIRIVLTIMFVRWAQTHLTP